MRLRLVVATVTAVATVALGTPASAAPAGQPSCTGISSTVQVFKQGGPPLLDWRENLEFDGRGRLWVSHVTGNRVEGYAPDGTLVATVPVPGPGGIRRGPDGLMYVNHGVNPLVGTGGIMRFDPDSPSTPPQRFATGLSGINGMAVDQDGNFYLGREFASGVLKVRADGTVDQAWTDASAVFGSNGVTVSGRDLYAAVIVNPRSPIERIPLDNPAAHSTVADLSPFVLGYKGLDDLEAVGDHLIVAGFVSGELIRVNRHTGAACVLVRGLITPTSVRVPAGFGGHDPARELFVTEASGRILQITTSTPLSG